MKTKLLRLFIVMTISITALFALGMTAAAETVGAFEVTGGTEGEDYTYTDGVLTVIKDGATLTVANTDPSTPTTDRIEVATDVSANITLAGVNIKLSGWGNCAFKIADNSTGDVTVTLADGTTNTLASSNNAAGLQKNGSGDDVGTLTINGTGTLNASTESASSYSAGIGGSVNNSTKNIIITSGVINATGSLSAAGIGSGAPYSTSEVLVADNIQIKGGTITATGGDRGAGIGGAQDGAGSNITISGGTVIAIGGSSAAGIGGGRDGAGSNITISGGTVTATGGKYAAGIGGGDGGAGSDITISGGTVTATGGQSSAAIGGGYYNEGSNITIKNSIVYVTAGIYASNSIGDGAYSSNSLTDTPTITDAIIVDNTAKTITVYGNATLTEDFEVPTDYTMTIPEDATLTVGTDVTFTNNGTVTNNGTIENRGTITGNPVGGTVNTYDFVITGGTEGEDYTYTSGVLTVIKDGANLTVANKTPSTPTADRIEVADGVSANIILAGVNINSSEAAFMIADDSTGNVIITLADGTTNTLKSGDNYAGLQKNGTYSDTLGMLTIQGDTGILNVTGGDYAAGIGGGYNDESSNIIIDGGTITATGGDYSAGIGGGYFGIGYFITINGGTVIATGGTDGAGIGGGWYSTGENITINGGTVTATGSSGGEGIGGGDSGVSGTITISGGSVKASSIGFPPKNGTDKVYLLTIANPNGETVIIDDAEYTPADHTAADPADKNLYVYLTGKAHTVKVGESTIHYDFDSTSKSFVALGWGLTVTGTDLFYGTDYTYPADTGVLTILSPKAVTIRNADGVAKTTDRILVADGVNANITLAGVNIDVSSYYTPAFSIYSHSTGNVTITLADGTTNTLKSGTNCAGLQKNSNSSIGMLTIQGEGSLTAIGGDYGTGIGSGDTSDSSNILIKSGIINAQGGKCAAGIGGGYYGAGTDITISGGTVTVEGGESGAGIGGGYKGAGKNITISGGTVTATGGENGAGIGGGENGAGSGITVNGGTVTATGGYSGAGIGGGNWCAGTNITISGGTVAAMGGGYGAGIGGGYNGAGSGITISGGSVKAVAGEGANAIGGGYGTDAVIPTDGNGDNVYLLTIANPNGEVITIDGIEYTPIDHTAADPADTNLYVYLPAKTAADPNVVTVGEETTKYYYDTTNSKWLMLVDAPEKDETPFTYNGEVQTYTLPESDYYTISGNKQTNAGDHTVTVALNDGYIWSDGETAAKEYTFTIAKAELTVTAENLTVKLGNPLPTTFGYTVSGLEGADTEAVLDNANLSFSYENGVTPSALGDYAIIMSGDAEIANYTITYVNGKLTITEKAVQTITADDVVLTYGDTDGKITATTDGDGAIFYEVATGTDVISVDENGNITVLKFGTATVTITAEDTFDYAEATKTVTVTVNKAAATVTAKSYTIKVGDTLPTYAYDVTGLVNGETLPINVTISCTADGKTAGTYDIVVSGAATSTNYTFSYVKGTLTVTAKAVQTITASDVTLTYGDTNGKITAATDGDGAISYEVATGADVISVAADGAITVLKAGTATVTVKAAETDTYAAATKTVTVTVNKAAVTVTAKSYTIKVGDTLPTYEYDVTGLVNGGTLPINVTISCTADGKTAGTYDIVVSGAATSTNYTFSYVKGTLTVSEKEVVAAPTFTPASGTTFTSTQNVTIACATEGAKIYYTTDGTEPTTASTKYTGAITITSTTTIKAIAVKDGMADSAVVTATYTKKSSGGGGGGGYTPSRPSTPNNPEINGKSASWTTIADDISKLPIGSEVTIELNGNYDVPVDVIIAILANEVKVTFVVDSARNWYVDGARLGNPDAADLSIITIASLNTDTLRGEVGTKFRIDNVNIPAGLKFTFAKTNAGKFANLYKKDGDKLVFVDNVKIDANGVAAFADVSNKGDYVVMLCEYSDRKGDVSNDGVTNSLDASAVLKDIVELEDAANPEMLDYNGDGKVNALDASAILIDIVNDRI